MIRNRRENKPESNGRSPRQSASLKEESDASLGNFSQAAGHLRSACPSAPNLDPRGLLCSNVGVMFLTRLGRAGPVAGHVRLPARGACADASQTPVPFARQTRTRRAPEGKEASERCPPEARP